MKRPEKEAVVAQLTDKFREADAIYLTEYRGLTVPQISELREKLGRDTSYTVAKNTLIRIAAKEAGIEGLDEILAGPTAVTFVKGDFIEAAKTLRDFAKTNKALIIKGASLMAPSTMLKVPRSWQTSSLARSCSPSSPATSRLRCPRPRTCSTLCRPRPCVRSMRSARSRKRLPDFIAVSRVNDSDHKRKIIVLGDGHLFNQTVAKNERKPLWLSTPTMSCSKLSVR